jgi:hypothetical protein
MVGLRKVITVEKIPTPAKLAQEFIRSRKNIDVRSEKPWIQSVFACILKVSRKNSTFLIDDVWQEIDAMSSRGSLPKTRLDPRILGVMLRFATAEGVIEPSGYYAKSDRPGSRPVTVWSSCIFGMSKAAA